MVCQVSQVRADQAARSTLLDVFGQHKAYSNTAAQDLADLAARDPNPNLPLIRRNDAGAVLTAGHGGRW